MRQEHTQQYDVNKNNKLLRNDVSGWCELLAKMPLSFGSDEGGATFKRQPVMNLVTKLLLTHVTPAAERQ